MAATDPNMITMNGGYGYPPGYTPPGQNQGGYDANGNPIRPNYIPGYNPYTMGISQGLDSQLGGINVDTTGLDKFRTEAERTGPSAWAQLAGQQQDLEGQNQREQAARTSGAQGAQEQGQLAMSGGLSSGARERVSRDAGRSALGMDQNIQRQENQNKMQIGVNDEQNRIQQLGSLPGMENQAAQIPLQKAQLWAQGQQFDVGNQVAEAGRQNDFNLGNYHEQMAAWGAGQQANATANSGKK